MCNPSNFDEDTKFGVDCLPQTKPEDKSGECSFGKEEEKDQQTKLRPVKKESQVSQFKPNTQILKNRRSMKRNNTTQLPEQVKMADKASYKDLFQFIHNENKSNENDIKELEAKKDKNKDKK